MNPKLWRLSLVLTTAIVAASYGEWRSEDWNCSVTPPNTPEWSQPAPPDPHFRLFAETKDKSISVYLAVYPMPPEKRVKLDAGFIESFEKHYFAGAERSKKISGVEIVIQGVPAYKLKSELYIKDKTFYRANTLMVADDRLYMIAAMKMNSPPLDDPAVRAFVGSFRFLHPPKI